MSPAAVHPLSISPIARPCQNALALRLTQLRETIEGLDLSQDEFETRPAWHIALVLQAVQAQRLGLRPDYGIDYQLLQAARQFSTPVIELEGTENQVAILRQLADGGLELLQDTLTHWRENARCCRS
jgi:uncharacterized protein YbaP (TraB family)